MQNKGRMEFFTPTGRGRWRHEDRAWTNGTIRAILENPAYYGARSYNRNSNSKIVAQRNDWQMTPGVRYPHWRNNRTDWVTLENAHPAIISHETWEQANRRSQATILSKPKHDVPYLLSGLIRCGNCGSPFQGHSTKKKDRYYYRYICGGFNAKRNCTYCSIKRELLEDFVLNSIRETLCLPKVADRFEEKLSLVLKNQNSSETSETARLQDSIKAKEREAKNVADAVAQHGPIPSLIKKISGVEGELSKMRDRMTYLRKQMTNIPNPVHIRQEIEEFARGFESRFQRAPDHEKKA